MPPFGLSFQGLPLTTSVYVRGRPLPPLLLAGDDQTQGPGFNASPNRVPSVQFLLDSSSLCRFFSSELCTRSSCSKSIYDFVAVGTTFKVHPLQPCGAPSSTTCLPCCPGIARVKAAEQTGWGLRPLPPSRLTLPPPRWTWNLSRRFLR